MWLEHEQAQQDDERRRYEEALNVLTELDAAGFHESVDFLARELGIDYDRRVFGSWRDE